MPRIFTYGLGRSGRVKALTPNVIKEELPLKPKGRSGKRRQANRNRNRTQASLKPNSTRSLQQMDDCELYGVRFRSRHRPEDRVYRYSRNKYGNKKFGPYKREVFSDQQQAIADRVASASTAEDEVAAKRNRRLRRLRDRANTSGSEDNAQDNAQAPQDTSMYDVSTVSETHVAVLPATSRGRTYCSWAACAAVGLQEHCPRDVIPVDVPHQEDDDEKKGDLVPDVSGPSVASANSRSDKMVLSPIAEHSEYVQVDEYLQPAGGREEDDEKAQDEWVFL